MGRYLTAILVIGSAAILGLMVTRTIPRPAIVTQATAAQSVSFPPASAPVRRPATSQPFVRGHYHDAAIAASVPDSPAARVTLATSDSLPATSTNRFDRGRLDEEFDGEPIHGSARKSDPIAESPEFEFENAIASEAADPSEVAQADRQPTAASDFSFPSLAGQPRQQALAVEDPFHPTIPDPLRPSMRSPLAPASSQLRPSPRVTLIRTSDHQIRIVPEGKVLPETDGTLPVGAISITADEFILTPPSELGAGNQLQCTGHIVIRGENFTAHGSKLSVRNNDVVLEGTAEQPADIIKAASANDNPAAIKAGTSEFQLSALKISFTLTLDKLHVGTGATIEPESQPGKDTKDAVLPIESSLLQPTENLNGFRIETSLPFDAPVVPLPIGTIEIGPVPEPKAPKPPK